MPAHGRSERCGALDHGSGPPLAHHAPRMRFSIAVTLPLCATVLLGLAGCGKSNAAGDELVLAAYTTPREAYGKAILPAFIDHWKEKSGKTISFKESYQGSGAEARAVAEGFEADIVALSLAPDIEKLVDADLVD